MARRAYRNSPRWQDWATVVIGVLVFVAPWVLGFSGMSGMAWSAWIAGVLAFLLGGSVLIEDWRSHKLLARQN